MILNLKKFFTYLDDCNKTLPPNEQYDALIKKLMRGEVIEVLEGGLWKYMGEYDGKIVFVTKMGHA